MSTRRVAATVCVSLNLGVASLAALSAGHFQSPTPSRTERWHADLDTLARELSANQLDFAKLYPQARFRAEIESIERSVPTARDADLVLAIMRLVASANVAHTTVRFPQGPLAFHRLPITLAWYADSLAVTGASEPYREAIGLHVVKIGTLTPAAIEAAVAPFIAHETDGWLHQQSPAFIVTGEVLRRIGQVSADGRVTLTMARDNGSTFDIRVVPDTGAASPQLQAADVLRIPTALFRKQPGSYYWYEHLPAAKTVYVQYNRCQDDPKQPFADFARRLFEFADAQQLERVIVDLRLNGGGNSEVIKPLVAGLHARPALRARGRLFALIGRSTFSSGLLAAVNFRQDLHAVLIGEPAGEKPNSYGEVKTFTLPHSQIAVQYSTKFFRIVKDSDPPAYMPDVIVTRTLADALGGRDPVLDAALKYIRK